MRSGKFDNMYMESIADFATQDPNTIQNFTLCKTPTGACHGRPPPGSWIDPQWHPRPWPLCY